MKWYTNFFFFYSKTCLNWTTNKKSPNDNVGNVVNSVETNPCLFESWSQGNLGHIHWKKYVGHIQKSKEQGLVCRVCIYCVVKLNLEPFY
jgi:hypothetical protein